MGSQLPDAPQYQVLALPFPFAAPWRVRPPDAQGPPLSCNLFAAGVERAQNFPPILGTYSLRSAQNGYPVAASRNVGAISVIDCVVHPAPPCSGPGCLTLMKNFSPWQQISIALAILATVFYFALQIPWVAALLG